MSSAAPSDSDASQAYGSGRARYTLGLLLVMFIFGHIDRNILNVFIEQIKAEFGASDFVMGLLAGFYFVIFYTLAGVPIARLADRKSRKAIILCGLTLWSVMTALQGAVRAFWHLAAARVAVGVGEATISPSAHSIIADLYPPERRALPLGIYALGGHIGILIGFAFGGLVAERLGWRTAFVMVGLPGLVIAVIGWLTLREPARGQSEARRARSETPKFGEVLRYLLKRRSFVHLNLAAALYAGVAGTFNVWGITFMQRIHGMGLAEAGVSFGLATGIPGVLGTLTSGWLVDRLASRDRRWSIWIPALGGVAMLPFSAAFVFADDPQLGLLAYAVQVFLGTFWMAPGFATGQALAKLQMRATAAAIFLLVINVLGLVVLPALVGAASDLLSVQYGSAGLRYALLGLASCNLWGVCHSLLMSRSLEADLAAAAAD